MQSLGRMENIVNSDYANVARPVEDDFEMAIKTSTETLLSTNIFKEGEKSHDNWTMTSKKMGGVRWWEAARDYKVGTCKCCTGNMYEVVKRQALIG